MQLSAANLLIASQQIARGTLKAQPDAQAQFAAALAKEKGTLWINHDAAQRDTLKMAPAFYE